MNEHSLAPKLSRRQFLKVAALAAVADKLCGGSTSSLVETAAAAAATEEKWISTSCRECRQHDRVRVRVVNDVAVEIAGVPDDPSTLGRICGKGQAGLMHLYNPYRVRNPMKRTNPEKGLGVDPKWVEISWDEALNTVAEKLKPVLKEDPRQFFFAATFGTVVRGVVGGTFGTPNEVGWGPGEFCGGGMHLGYQRGSADDSPGIDYEYCKYVLNVGQNCYGTGKGGPFVARPFLNAQENGLKMVVIDPAQAMDARKADEWLPIRPATDQALFLAMENTLVNELNRYDVEHLKLRTNGPYLIGPDGWYVRSKTKTYDDPLRKQTLGKPLIWDAAENVAKTFDDPTIKDYALEGSFTVDGVKCQPAFQLLKDFLKKYTAEWAEPITTIPAVTIRRIAKEFVDAAQIGATKTFNDDPDGPYTLPLRPAAVLFLKGSQGHYHAALICRAIYMLAQIVGGTNVVGSTRGDGGLKTNPVTGPDGVLAPSSFMTYRFTFPPQRIDTYDAHPLVHSAGTHIAHAILDPAKYNLNYGIKVMGIHFTNPFKSMYNGKVVEAAMKKIPFIFAISYHFDEPTEMADIVLPEPSYLERLEVFSMDPRWSLTEWKNVGTKYMYIRQPVVKPLYNTKNSMDILGEIATRAGLQAKFNTAMNSSLRLADAYKLDPNKKYAWAEIADRQLKSNWGDAFGLEWFKANGAKGTPVKSRKGWYGYNKNPKVRYPIYDEYIKWAGEKYKADLKKNGIDIRPEVLAEFIPLPEWKGTGPLEQASKDYDLYAINAAETYSAMSMAMENPWKVEYAQKFDPYTMVVWLNADVGKKKGIKDGDQIKVESQFGFSVTGEAKLTEGLHPECVMIPGGLGNQSVNLSPLARLGTGFNWLVGSDEEQLSPLGGNVEGSPRVKVSRV